MKTRIKANVDRTSFRLDVVDEVGLKQYYFKNVDEALEFQNNLIRKTV